MTDNTQNPSPKKGKQPDFDVHQVIEQEDGKSQWLKVGAMWRGKDGYISGETVHGRLVLQSKEAKQALQEMRKQEQTAQAPDINPAP